MMEMFLILAGIFLACVMLEVCERYRSQGFYERLAELTKEHLPKMCEDCHKNGENGSCSGLKYQMERIYSGKEVSCVIAKDKRRFWKYQELYWKK